MNDVALLFIAGMCWLVVMYLLYRTIKRLWAKVHARKIIANPEGNLKLVVWDHIQGMSETLTVFTTIPMMQQDAIIRAVRMWGVVGHKSIIEIAVPSQDEIIYRTY